MYAGATVISDEMSPQQNRVPIASESIRGNFSRAPISSRDNRHVRELNAPLFMGDAIFARIFPWTAVLMDFNHVSHSPKDQCAARICIGYDDNTDTFGCVHVTKGISDIFSRETTREARETSREYTRDKSMLLIFSLSSKRALKHSPLRHRNITGDSRMNARWQKEKKTSTNYSTRADADGRHM